jgi:hypothetical protein
MQYLVSWYRCSETRCRASHAVRLDVRSTLKHRCHDEPSLCTSMMYLAGGRNVSGR